MERKAAWSDVKRKAFKLYHSGAVHPSVMTPERFEGTVDGHHGTYNIVLAYPGGRSNPEAVNWWSCDCLWGQWCKIMQRFHLRNRFCSHALAAAVYFGKNKPKTWEESIGGDNPNYQPVVEPVIPVPGQFNTTAMRTAQSDPFNQWIRSNLDDIQEWFHNIGYDFLDEPRDSAITLYDIMAGYICPGRPDFSDNPGRGDDLAIALEASLGESALYFGSDEAESIWKFSNSDNSKTYYINPGVVITTGTTIRDILVDSQGESISMRTAQADGISIDVDLIKRWYELEYKLSFGGNAMADYDKLQSEFKDVTSRMAYEFENACMEWAVGHISSISFALRQNGKLSVVHGFVDQLKKEYPDVVYRAINRIPEEYKSDIDDIWYMSELFTEISLLNNSIGMMIISNLMNSAAMLPGRSKDGNSVSDDAAIGISTLYYMITNAKDDGQLAAAVSYGVHVHHNGGSIIEYTPNGDNFANTDLFNVNEELLDLSDGKYTGQWDKDINHQTTRNFHDDPSREWRGAARRFIVKARNLRRCG